VVLRFIAIMKYMIAAIIWITAGLSFTKYIALFARNEGIYLNYYK